MDREHMKYEGPIQTFTARTNLFIMRDSARGKMRCSAFYTIVFKAKSEILFTDLVLFFPPLHGNNHISEFNFCRPLFAFAANTSTNIMLNWSIIICETISKAERLRYCTVFNCHLNKWRSQKRECEHYNPQDVLNISSMIECCIHINTV